MDLGALLAGALPAIVSAAVVALIGIVTVLFARIFGYEVDIGRSPFRFRVTRVQPAPPPPTVLPRVEPPSPSAPSPELRERQQLRDALFYYSESATSMYALLGCAAADRDSFARAWSDGLAAGLEIALKTSNERYRVSLWASRGDADHFDAVGLGTFNATDKRMQKLERAGTIAGDAFGSATGEKYCPDIHDPSCGWRQRDAHRPRYKSVFAKALETLDGDNRRWGVMTIDCNEKDGFSQVDRQVLDHFAGLASLGELVWRLKGAGGTNGAGTGP